MCLKKVGDCNNCLGEFVCSVPYECSQTIACEDCRFFHDCDVCLCEYEPKGDEE